MGSWRGHSVDVGYGVLDRRCDGWLVGCFPNKISSVVEVIDLSTPSIVIIQT